MSEESRIRVHTVEADHAIGNTAAKVKTYIQTADSIAEFANQVREDIGSGKIKPLSGTWLGHGDGFSSGHDWDLGIKGEDACRMACTGDASIVTKVQTFLEKVAITVGAGPRNQSTSSLYGSRVSVPDYLGGNPRCMRRMTKREGTVRHVNVYVSGTCSTGIPASDMLKRGQAILALLEALQAQQIAVDLFMTGMGGADSGNSDIYQCVRVESRPLDIAVSGFAIAHPAFTRNVMYNAEVPYGYNGLWPATFDHGFGGGGTRKHDKYFRDLMGMATDDVYCPPVAYGDEIIGNPEKWIQERLYQIVGNEAA